MSFFLSLFFFFECQLKKKNTETRDTCVFVCTVLSSSFLIYIRCPSFFSARTATSFALNSPRSVAFVRRTCRRIASSLQPLVQQLNPDGESVRVELRFENARLTIRRNDESNVVFRVSAESCGTPFDFDASRLAAELLSVHRTPSARPKRRVAFELAEHRRRRSVRI